jgi:hypothetical protein
MYIICNVYNICILYMYIYNIYTSTHTHTHTAAVLLYGQHAYESNADLTPGTGISVCGLKLLVSETLSY